MPLIDPSPPLIGQTVLSRFLDVVGQEVEFAAAGMAHCRYKAILVSQLVQGQATTAAQAVLRIALQTPAVEFACPAAELFSPLAKALATHV